MKNVAVKLFGLTGMAIVLGLIFSSGLIFGQEGSAPEKPVTPGLEPSAAPVTPPVPVSPTPPAPVSPTPPAPVLAPQPVTPTPPVPVTPTLSAPPQTETPGIQDGITQKEIGDLISQLSANDPMLIKDVRDELKEIGRPAVSLLVKALGTSKPEVRYLLCEILGEIRDSGSVGALVGLLDDRDEHTASVASAAARALRNCADLSVIPHLIKAVTSTDIDLRYESVKTLGLLRAYQALPVIRKVITDTSKTSLGYQVRTAAIQALGRLRDNSSVKNLIPMLKSNNSDSSGDPLVRHVISALEQITGYQAGSFSRSDAKKKEATLEKWEEWWEKNRNNKDYE